MLLVSQLVMRLQVLLKQLMVLLGKSRSREQILEGQVVSYVLEDLGLVEEC